jgi:hypothetical protein
MKPDGSCERILTSGYHNEGPTFAPNGRVVDVLPGSRASGPALYTPSTLLAATSRSLPTPASRPIRRGRRCYRKRSFKEIRTRFSSRQPLPTLMNLQADFVAILIAETHR